MAVSEPLIRSTEPRREWLVRCSDAWRDLAVCSVEVNRGEIGIFGPRGDVFTLNRAEIADFRTALDAAIGQAESDLRAERAGRAADYRI